MNISVIITTYNRSFFVKRAIDSVLSQTTPAYEIIVIDDGSSDDTGEILKEYEGEIKTIYQDNQGVSAARNRGVDLSRGDWIAFLDSDDIWHNKKLQIQSLFHKKNPLTLFSHTNEIWIRDGKRVSQKKRHKKPNGDCFYENLDFCKISPSTVMINKKLLKECGGFDEDLLICEDYDLWLRVLKKEPVGLIEESLTYKYAGNWRQLSFSNSCHDLYHIKALLKHLPDLKVENKISQKLSILQKGAKKHKNDLILAFCKEVSSKLDFI